MPIRPRVALVKFSPIALLVCGVCDRVNEPSAIGSVAGCCSETRPQVRSIGKMLCRSPPWLETRSQQLRVELKKTPSLLRHLRELSIPGTLFVLSEEKHPLFCFGTLFLSPFCQTDFVSLEENASSRKCKEKSIFYTCFLFPFVFIIPQEAGCLVWLRPASWLNPWVLLLNFREKEWKPNVVWDPGLSFKLVL